MMPDIGTATKEPLSFNNRLITFYETRMRTHDALMSTVA